MSKNAARLVDGIFDQWLTHSKMGKELVADHGFDSAMASLWELLNAGFVKIQRDGDLVDVIPVNPPEPPSEKMARPAALCPGKGQPE